MTSDLSRLLAGNVSGVRWIVVDPVTQILDPGQSLSLMPREDLRAVLSSSLCGRKKLQGPLLENLRDLSPQAEHSLGLGCLVWRAGLCPKRAPQEYILHRYVLPPSVLHRLCTKTTAHIGLHTSHSQLWEEEIRSKDRRLILGSALRLLCRCKQVVGHVTLLSKMRFLSGILLHLYKPSARATEAGEL